ncbi:unnamed protein product [Paramecium pentaurelia]|uniref:VIT domain-containing protein n=1 Tax=Paramecium pentaurelia TaxID=43138 RepID=A0A8S1VUZ1_9CILI|nr:unnamed protein product [Paramecium pentaurelia]
MNQNKLYEPKVCEKEQKLYYMKQESYKNINIFVCYDLTKKALIPLKFAKYSTKIKPGLCIVELELIYSSEEQNDRIELEYVFSINEDAVVTKMVVELFGACYPIFTLFIQENLKSYSLYAIVFPCCKPSSQSYLASSFSFTTPQTLISPNKQLKITFEYIQPLEVFLNKFLKFNLFPIVDQNYVSQNRKTMIGIHGIEIYEYLNRLFKINDFKFQFRQEIEVEIDFGSPIKFWKSPTHKLQSTNAKQSEDVKSYGNNKKLILVLQDIPDNYEPTKQFTLLFSSDEINLPDQILIQIDIVKGSIEEYSSTIRKFLEKGKNYSLIKKKFLLILRKKLKLTQKNL